MVVDNVIAGCIRKEKFSTSDNPTVLNNHLAFMEDNGKTSGFELPHSQIFLPISSKLMLTLTAGPMAEESRTRLLKVCLRRETVLS